MMSRTGQPLQWYECIYCGADLRLKGRKGHLDHCVATGLQQHEEVIRVQTIICTYSKTRGLSIVDGGKPNE